MNEKEELRLRETLIELHGRYTNLESEVEAAINELRKGSGGDESKREVANRLESALEGESEW